MEPNDPKNPIPQRPEGEPVAPEEQHPLAHTYKDDLAQAMNATEAPVVQAMLADARDREEFAIEEIHDHSKRKWYSIGSLFFVLLMLAVAGYGTYYYMHLTVKVQPTQSVGVFPGTINIASTGITIQELLKTLSADTTLSQDRPTLVNLVTDTQTNTLLSNSQLYAFIGAAATEPLQATVSVVRLGVLNTGKEVIPFIIMSVPDPEKASKEFAIAEKNLLPWFGPGLGIDLSKVQNQVGQTFQSQYFYNLPVRSLNTVTTVTTPPQLIFLYGYANNNTIVITEKPEVMKAVYDALVNQH